MPQTFQVLRCYKCLVFQVHQVKKSNRWPCKLCGEKQSHKRRYALGSAKDCRVHVQKLNGLRGELEEVKQLIDTDSEEEAEDIHNREQNINHYSKRKAVSKWKEFINEDDESEALQEPDAKENIFMGKEVVLEVPNKRRKKWKTPLLKDNDCNIYNKGDNPDSCLETYSKATLLPAPNLHITSATSTSKSKPAVFNINYQINDIKVKNIFKPTSTNENSKWAEFVDEDPNDDDVNNVENDDEQTAVDDLITAIDKNNTKSDCEDVRKENTVQFDDVETAKNSGTKWNEFVDEDFFNTSDKDISVEADGPALEFEEDKKKKTQGNPALFSLCDDNEIDEVLDF